MVDESKVLIEPLNACPRRQPMGLPTLSQRFGSLQRKWMIHQKQRRGGRDRRIDSLFGKSSDRAHRKTALD